MSALVHDICLCFGQSGSWGLLYSVTLFKFLVYSVNNTQPTLLYVIGISLVITEERQNSNKFYISEPRTVKLFYDMQSQKRERVSDIPFGRPCNRARQAVDNGLKSFMKLSIFNSCTLVCQQTACPLGLVLKDFQRIRSIQDLKKTHLYLFKFYSTVPCMALEVFFGHPEARNQVHD